MGAIINLISSSGFIAVNKHLAKMYGLDEAVLLGELASEYKYWEARGEVKDGYFYSTVENVQENTTLSDRRQRAAIKTLKEAGIISVKVKGQPPKRYFMINEARLMQELNLVNAQNQFLQNERIEPCETQELNLAERKTNNNIPNNNKGNKNNQKASKRANDSFDSLITDYAKGNAVLIDLLGEWLKVRKAKRAAMTDRAISMNLEKLDEMAKQSRMTVEEYLKEVICRGWAAFYAINSWGGQNKKTARDNMYYPPVKGDTNDNDDFMDMLGF